MAIAGSYVAMKYLIVDTEPPAFHLPSAILLPILTGLTETLRILSMFVVGTGLGYPLFPKRKAVPFFWGYLFYVLINAVIHIGFWNWMLPMHFYANIYIVIFGQQVFSLAMHIVMNEYEIVKPEKVLIDGCALAIKLINCTEATFNQAKDNFIQEGFDD